MQYFRLTNVNTLETKEITEAYLEQIAIWHNQTPKLWVPNYQATRKDIDESIQKIKAIDLKDLFLGIAVDESKAIQGFIWANKQKDSEDSVMIMSLFTSNNHRKEGLATQLKIMLEAWCKEEGIKTILTTVHYNNHKMLALNEKLGYAPGMVNMTKLLD